MSRARGSLIPTERETHGGVDETITETNVSTGNGQESDDFTERNLYRRQEVHQATSWNDLRSLELTITQ